MRIADNTYYLDEDGKVTTDEGLAKVQLVVAGSPIPGYILDKYGDALSGETKADVPVTIEFAQRKKKS